MLDVSTLCFDSQLRTQLLELFPDYFDLWNRLLRLRQFNSMRSDVLEKAVQWLIHQESKDREKRAAEYQAALEEKKEQEKRKQEAEGQKQEQQQPQQTVEEKSVPPPAVPASSASISVASSAPAHKSKGDSLIPFSIPFDPMLIGVLLFCPFCLFTIPSQLLLCSSVLLVLFFVLLFARGIQVTARS